MKVVDTELTDVKLITPEVYGDKRGFFMETFRDDWFRQNVADVKFVQDNFSRSERAILRGLHYQLTQPQGKLIRVTHGSVFDVAVDMREYSPTFGKWVGVELSAENKLQMWVPAGFAHGFYVTSNYAEFFYRCTDYYHPDSEVSVIYNDAQLRIDWPLINNECPILSAKDKAAVAFKDAQVFK